MRGGGALYDATSSPYETIRSKNYVYISEAIIDFSKFIKSVFGDNALLINELHICSWINGFSLNPTESDKKNFSHIYHAWEINHQEYIPIFPSWYKDKKITTLQKIFSITNENGYKVIRIGGAKVKIKRK